jgi:RES domain-containing protein
LNLTAWRLLKTRRLAKAWDGESAKINGGRWNSVGVPVVYTSSSLSLALVEVLVHSQLGLPLEGYSAVPIEFDDTLVATIHEIDLPPNWKALPAPTETKAIGDEWVAKGSSPILRVPSTVVLMEPNFVLNPHHRDFARIATHDQSFAVPSGSTSIAHASTSWQG